MLCNKLLISIHDIRSFFKNIESCVAQYDSLLEYALAGVGGEQLEALHAHDRVALGIESRTPDSHAVLAREHGCDASTDAALAGQAHEVGELAGLVLESARLRDGVHALDLG